MAQRQPELDTCSTEAGAGGPGRPGRGAPGGRGSPGLGPSAQCGVRRRALVLSDLQAVQVLLGQVVAEAVLLLETRAGHWLSVC